MKIEILIIDDSLEIGETLQEIMKILGFESVYFDSSEKAMLYFKNELNPVIFLDIFMPNQNGLELLPTIKKISPFTQVVMMTGGNDIENVVASLKNKASDFLFKPFSMESVKVAVERGVEYYNLLKDNFNYQENLERDMKFISSIQKQVISPRKNSPTIYADFYAYSFVSGSFYHTEEMDGKDIILFGDIEGNGVTSSFIGLLIISMLKDILKKETIPSKILTLLNDELYYKINIHTLTAICLVIDRKLNQIYYSNGGNTSPILLTKNSNEIAFLNSEVSNIIGVMPGTEFVTKSANIVEDSILFLYNPSFLPSETNSRKEFESFIKKLQSIYSETNSFDSIKIEVDNYSQENLKLDSQKNLSFFLQKL